MMHGSFDSAIAGRYLFLLCESFASEGTCPDSLLQGTGLPTELLRCPEAFVSKDDLERFLSNIETQTDEPFPGLRLGYSLNISHHGSLGFAAATASTLQRGIETTCRYFPLITNLLTPKFEVNRSHGEFRMLPVYGLSQQAESFLVQMLLASCDLMSSVVMPGLRLEAELAMQESEGFLKRLSPSIQCVKFNGQMHRIFVDHKALDKKQLLSDSISHRHLCETCAKDFENLRADQRTAGSVSKLLRVHECPVTANQQAVAQSLGMSSRTLYRRLNQERTSFRELLEHEVFKRAKHYLLVECLSVSQTAYLLGFTQPAGFTKAFRQVMGMTPSRFVELSRIENQ